MVFEESLSYVLLGYEKAIVSLMKLDHKSETIQTLVGLIYHLESSDSDGEIIPSETRQIFATQHIQAMLNRADDYIAMHGEEEFEYLLRAIAYFGNNA